MYKVHKLNATVPSPFYDTSIIEWVEVKEVKPYKLYDKGDLVLAENGFIRKVMKDKFGKGTNIPSALVSDVTIDGERMCSAYKHVKPVAEFPKENEKYSRACTYCQDVVNRGYKNKANPNSRANFKAWTEEQKIKDILEHGVCCVEGCRMNEMQEWIVEEKLLGLTEYNHIDTSTKLQSLSQASWYSQARAKRHGSKDARELWLAERAKCELMCRGHHVNHSMKQRTEQAAKRRKKN